MQYHAITLELQSLVAQHTDRAKFSELGVDHIKYDEQSLKSRLENTVGPISVGMIENYPGSKQ